MTMTTQDVLDILQQSTAQTRSTDDRVPRDPALCEQRAATLAQLVTASAVERVAEQLAEIVERLDLITVDVAAASDRIDTLGDVHLTGVNDALVDIRAELEPIADAAERPLFARPLFRRRRLRPIEPVPPPVAMPTPHDSPDAVLQRIGL